MVSVTKTPIYGLNIEANPHPEGIYPRLLRQAAKAIVQARGSDYAKITSPRTASGHIGYYLGRILIWTDIDLRSKWLDLSNEDELPDNIKSLIQIPPNAKPNYRTFDYVLAEAKHQIWFEAKNELGYRLGPSTARRIFSTLLSTEIMGSDYPHVEVTVIPEEGAVDRILQLPRLQTLTIRVTLPNPDASSAVERARVFGRLEAAHAQRVDLTLTKAPGSQRLTPDGEYAELARVGADSGFVKGEERANNGEKVSLSTTQLPKRVYIDDTPGRSFISKVVAKLGG